MSKLQDIIRDINNDGYEDGQLGAGHPASIVKWEEQIKDLILVLIGNDYPNTDDYDEYDANTKDPALRDQGANAEKANLRRKVDAL